MSSSGVAKDSRYFLCCLAKYKYHYNLTQHLAGACVYIGAPSKKFKQSYFVGNEFTYDENVAYVTCEKLPFAGSERERSCFIALSIKKFCM